MIVSNSCSKNFGLYRERTGALSVVCRSSEKADDVVTVINSLTRKNYSMPPTHGPGIVDVILHDDELSAQWREDSTTPSPVRRTRFGTSSTCPSPS